jgi:uncharacterized protein YndB with AHSA1/START domain
MLKKILIAAAAALAVLLLAVATRPATFRVERSLVVKAPPDKVYGELADFHRWEGWSPWAKLDPQMKTTYQGAEGLVGASYDWQGNDKVGQGRMTITAAAPPRQLVIRLEFLAPWKSTNQTTFDLAEAPGGTRVAWSMEGRYDFMGKAMSLFMNMDKVVGGDFERGLAALGRVAESGQR